MPLNNFFDLGNHPNLGSNHGPFRLNVRFNNQSNETSVSRKLLRRSFGNETIKLINGLNIQPHNRNNNNIKTTPFRVAFNSGDVNGSNNKYPDNDLVYKGSNQINNRFADGLSNNSPGSYFSGNPRYVYDSSDYLKYKKLKAINKNYNDETYGGDNHNSIQTVINRVR